MAARQASRCSTRSACCDQAVSLRCFRGHWNPRREISKRYPTLNGRRSPKASPICCRPSFGNWRHRPLMLAATLHRLCQTIERRLDDPDLTPARVADAEGISERYLQKLFEGSGSSFTHYLRERRLQRTSAGLSNPAQAAQSVSEIAYRNGFNDSAHFSRAFRHRFGVSPREFRQQEIERATD